MSILRNYMLKLGEERMSDEIMRYHILTPSNNKVIASFLNETDRDECLDFLQDRYSDSEVVSVDGGSEKGNKSFMVPE